ncbi:hypothetical protein YQE_02455, partial [Dendroctonus ponderosae]
MKSLFFFGNGSNLLFLNFLFHECGVVHYLITVNITYSVFIGIFIFQSCATLIFVLLRRNEQRQHQRQPQQYQRVPPEPLGREVFRRRRRH